MAMLQLGVPKGSLQDTTIEMFGKAGWNIKVSSRSYYPAIDDPEIECTLIRAQEMARYVGEGILDCGLTGHDWIVECGGDVVEVCELVYGKVGRNPLRWVLALRNSKHCSRTMTSRRSSRSIRSRFRTCRSTGRS